MPIKDIKDISTRNQLRGVEANTKKYVQALTIGRALKKCPESDIKSAINYLIASNHHEVYFGKLFPSNSSDLFVRPLEPIHSRQATLIIQCFLTSYREKALEILEAISDLNDAILRADYETACSTIGAFHDKFGNSRMLLRKLGYVASRLAELDVDSSDREVQKKSISAIMDTLLGDARSSSPIAYWNNALDVFDDEIDDIELIVKTVENVERLNEGSEEETSRIPRLTDVAFPTIDYDLPRNCVASEALFSSLVDMLIYAISRAYLHPDHSTMGIDSSFWKEINLPTDCLALGKLRDQEISTACLGQQSRPEYVMYRLSGALYEISEFGKWRTVIDGQIARRATALGRRATIAPISWFYAPNLKLRHLCTPAHDERINLTSYHNDSAGQLLRTFAVLERLYRGEKLIDLDAHQIRLLLNQTTGFANFLTIDELRELRTFKGDDTRSIIEFLALFMLHDRLGDEDTAFELRSTFESLLTDQFAGSFEDLLQWLKQRTPALCERVARLCDLPFLERLYHIMSSFDDVISARMKICNWMGQTFDSAYYKLSAERLSLDAKVRVIKGQIDDSRIYVDEIRFKQWLSDELSPTIRKHQRGLTGIRDESKERAFSNRSQTLTNTTSGLEENFGGPHYYFLDDACDLAFNKFCFDNIFGINSYLGRRIRHGTLRGTVLNPIKKLFNSERVQAVFDSTATRQEFSDWLTAYSSAVYEIRDEYLHFRSEKKKNGAFSPDPLGTDERKQIRLDYLKKIDDLFKRGLSYIDATTTLNTYCWAVLQTDLIRIQVEIPKIYRNQIRPKLRAIGNKYPDSHSVKQLVTEIDQMAEAVFKQLAEWFSEPETSALSASIRELCETVLAEMRNYHDGLSSVVEYSGSVDEKLYGSMYQHIYDILKVLIENVAEHGNAREKILLDVKLTQRKDTDSIDISFSSHLHPNANAEETKREITNALALDSAMEREGKSGLGKIASIVQLAARAPGKFDWEVRQKTTHFHISLPLVLVPTD